MSHVETDHEDKQQLEKAKKDLSKDREKHLTVKQDDHIIIDNKPNNSDHDDDPNDDRTIQLLRSRINIPQKDANCIYITCLV